MAMFTTGEYTALTGVTLTNDQYTLVERIAAGIIEAECGRAWDSDPDPITSVRRVDSSNRVVLPRPVASVDAIYIMNIDGTASTQALAGWQYDGIDTVWLVPTSLQLNAPEWRADDDFRGDTVQVTWTPAASTVPAAVTGVAIAIAARMKANPAGASSLSIDDYSQGFTGTSGGMLLPSERAVLARYKARAVSSQSVVTP